MTNRCKTITVILGMAAVVFAGVADIEAANFFFKAQAHGIVKSWKGYEGKFRQPSLAFDPAGNPRVCYASNISSQDNVRYAWSDDGGKTWQTVSVDDQAMYVDSVSLALDADGNPRIAYCDDDDLHYASSDDGGNTWTIKDFSYYGGGKVSLALDSAGNPHLSLSAPGWFTVNWQALFWKVMYFSSPDGGDSWNSRIVDFVPPYYGTFSVASLVLDGKDNPHIAYEYYWMENGTDKFEIRLANSIDSGKTWPIEAVDSGNGVVTETSLAVDSGGGIHIAYLNDKIGGPTPNTLWYAYGDPSTAQWTISELITGWVSNSFTVALIDDHQYGLKDTPVISYVIDLVKYQVPPFISTDLIAMTYRKGNTWISQYVLKDSPFASNGKTNRTDMTMAVTHANGSPAIGLAYTDNNSLFCSDPSYLLYTPVTIEPLTTPTPAPTPTSFPVRYNPYAPTPLPPVEPPPPPAPPGLDPDPPRDGYIPHEVPWWWPFKFIPTPGPDPLPHEEMDPYDQYSESREDEFSGPYEVPPPETRIPHDESWEEGFSENNEVIRYEEEFRPGDYGEEMPYDWRGMDIEYNIPYHERFHEAEVIDSSDCVDSAPTDRQSTIRYRPGSPK